MKKKIQNILFLCLGLLILTSCYTTFPNSNTYKIVYYLNGEQIDLEPSSYQTGTALELPAPSEYLKEEDVFSGWYLNANYTGEIVNEILITDSENKILFGKTTKKEPSNEEPKLSEILDLDSYTYIYEEKDSSYDYSEEYQYDNGKIAKIYEDYYGNLVCDYLYEVDGISRYQYEYNGIWYYTNEGEENYELYAPYMISVLLNEINVNNYTYSKEESCFIANEANLQEEVDNLMGSYDAETFKSFKIYLKENILDKMIIISDYQDQSGTIEITYTLTFNNLNQTNINIPNAIYDLDDRDDSLKIKDVYNLELGSVVSISGMVTGTYGNNFFINDSTKGILVYCGNNSEFSDLVENGIVLDVTGTISENKGVYQITNPTTVMLSNKTYQINPTNITNISQSNLAKYENDLVNLTNVKIESLPTSYNLTGTDTKFKISLNNETIEVFISKHVASNIKSEIFSILKTLKVGDLINLKNLHVGKYTDYQFVFCDQTKLEKGFVGEVKEIGLELSKNSLVKVVGVEEDEIINDINVYAVYNNGDKVQLKDGEYSVVSDFAYNEVGKFTFLYEYKNYLQELEVSVISQNDSLIVPEINNAPLYDVIGDMGYDPETNTTYGVLKGLPSTGNPKVLVIPVEFTDSLAPKSMVDDLETAFFGTSEETGWESLKSYYYKSSYGKLTIDGTVLEPFNTGYSTSYYDKLQKEFNDAVDAYLNYETDVYPDNVEYSIIKAALEYYDGQINYDDYDTDNDGYIDSIYLVYTRTYDDTSDESLWWAFTYEYYTEDIELYDNVEADYYVFMSYQFLFDELHGKSVAYNAETIIHETGHLLGLDDYYDYDTTTGPNGGIGGGDMMDYNVGDHNAYSKLILGWITPYITTSTTVTLDLKSFEESGECVMICKNWNGSFFTEFYIIDFFTPTGVNEIGKGDAGLFSTSGIRIYHVDATLNNSEDCFSVWDVTKYNNSYSDHRLITLIEADGRNDIDDNGYSENSDLFKTGDIYNNAKWYDNTKANFKIIVNEITTTNANITIEF